MEGVVESPCQMFDSYLSLQPLLQADFPDKHCSVEFSVVTDMVRFALPYTVARSHVTCGILIAALL